MAETPILSVTTLAAAKVKGLIADKGLTEEYGLRVFVAGGGCSGYQYGMAFENNPREDDKIVEIEGVKFIVDPASLPHIMGANVDYVDNLMGGGFRIDNPNAVSSCGCGNSFRPAGSDAPAATQGSSCGCG